MKKILHADRRQKQNHKEENLLALHQESFPLKEGIGSILNPGIHSLSEYEFSKKVIHLLRHSRQGHREEDGAVHFWRKKIFRISSHSLFIGLRAIVYFRDLEGNSGRNLIDPTSQDNIVIPSDFFQYIYHVGCGFNLHSITNSGLILGGQNSSKRQTVFFLLVGPMDKRTQRS